MLKAFLYSIFWLISIIPYPYAYYVSFIFSKIIGNIFGYRKNVILKNMQTAFPEKSIQELNKLRFEFYSNYAQMMIETIRILTINRKTLEKQVEFIRNNDFHQLLNEPKGAMILTGHRGNFEIAGQVFGQMVKHPIYAAYRSFRFNPYEKIMLDIRSRFKTTFIPDHQILKTIMKHKDEGMTIVFLNDQFPTDGKDHEWFEFFGQQTKFFIAPGKIAQKFNIPVYFMDMWKIKRGKYKINTEIISQNSSSMTASQILESYVRKLENGIRAHPSNWLWSHKRWKRDKDGKKFYYDPIKQN